MAPSPRPPRSAGGVFLAVGAVAGVLIGAAFGQTTLGLLVGFATGLLVALLLWLVQRRG